MSMSFRVPLHVAARAFALAALTLSSVCASLPAQAGVTVGGGVDQPGVYGRVVIGPGLPLPHVVLPRPVIVAPPPVVVRAPVVVPGPVAVPTAQPVYLYVPPGHRKHWHKHCHRYDACGQHVLFVRESWVQERHARLHAQAKPAPIHSPHRGHGNGHGHSHGHGHGHGKHRGRGHDEG